MPSVLSQSVVAPLRGIPRDGDGDGLIHDGTPHERPVPASPALPARPPARMRPIVDAPAVRRGIYERVRGAAAALRPLTNQRHTLALADVGYEGPLEFPKSAWKRAILGGRSLGARLRGTWTLTDNATGRVVDRRRTTVATVPYVTDHGTFIQNGSEYTLGHQLRLRPGVFARRRENGELEAHVNVMPGQGLSHRIYLEPESGVFRLRVGQANMALLPLLRALGADDRRLRGAWGDELYQVNQLKDDPSVVGKLHARLVRKPAADRTAEQEVRAAFEAMPLDPEVTRRTLGKPHDRVDLDTLLAATRKLIAINRGEAEPDDRDHLAYMTIHGPEDLLAERVGRDRMLLGKVLWKASMAGNLAHVQPELLTRGIQAAIMSSGLGQPTEGINPAMIFDQQARVSRLGEGGIPSLESVPAESRNVQPSHYGYIDPLVTPESLKVGIDSRLTQAARKGEDGRLYAPFRDVRTGKTEWKTAQDLADAVVAFPGELRKPDPYVNALVGGRARPVPRNRVQYELVHNEDSFSAISNLVPIKSTVKGQREVMAGRMITQALPVVDPEAPLVQAGTPDRPGDSYEARYGPHFGALRSDSDGVVLAADGDGIRVQAADGRVVDHQLYNNYPYNRKTYIHQTPVVRPGDRVRAGALLARSNYTDDQGVAALGKNARVAYVPFRGLNFEDAVVVSESFARRMTSEHMYQHGLDLEEGMQAGKKAHISTFPGKFSRAVLDTVDDDGAVKPGTTVNYGDPLVLAIKRRDRTHGSLHRGREASWVDRSETWGHHSPGLVTDVEKTARGTVVSVKSTNPTEVGDKLSGRYGDKGVVAAVVPDHEMPADGQGRPFEVLLNPLGIVTRTNPAQEMEAALGKIAERTGRPYRVVDFDDRVDYNEWALRELARHGMKSKETIRDPVGMRDIPGVLTGNRWFMKLHHTAECFDDKTEALTETGWKPWPVVTPRDRLATVDETGKLIFERPICVIQKPSPGLMYCFTGRYVDYAVTGNHRHYIRMPQAGAGWQFEEAERLHGRRFSVRQFGFAPPDGDEYSHLQVGGLVMTWADYVELVAWWATEGYAKATRRAASVTLYQSQSANPEKVDAIVALAQRLGVPWHYYKVDGEVFGVTISHRGLAEYLRYYGTHSENKRLPRDVFNAPPTVRQLGVEIMLDGDGNRQATPTGDRHRFSTTSKGLADDFQELCIRTGRGAVVRKDAPRKETRWLPSWTCGVALKRTDAQVDGDRNKAGFSVRPYNGVVYCAEMRTGLLYVRRNGKPMLTGNSKAQGRGTAGYTAEGRPAKGGETGSKRMSLMDINAVLSHGATEVLRDAGAIRGQQHPELWAQVMAGHAMPTPKTPIVWDKFLAQLKAAGINVVKDGTRLNVMALTGRDVDELAGDREVRHADTVDWKAGLKPIRGGLFDEQLTGGHGGTRWSFIRLPEALPNPVMEEPIRRMLGLTEKRFLAVLAGREKLDDRTGPGAIQHALGRIDVDRAIDQARADVRAGRKGARDAAVRKLGYLKAARKTGVHPRDWTLDKVPVLPPAFRPVSVMGGSKLPLVADANYLYKEVLEAADNFRAMRGVAEDLSDERLALYGAFKGAVGLGDPLHPKNQERQVKGVLRHIFGGSPKSGVVQRKLLASSTDLVGRSVIVPDPGLDMDQVGLPETRAWEVYRPFIVRRLRRRGMPVADALRAVEDRTPLARGALVEEMGERPVIINRAPVLHRYGMMAFRPRLTAGDTLRVPPLIVTGFGADFDGDAMQYHVPAEEGAVRDAYDKMLPSRNLLAASNFRVHQLPGKEYGGGLYVATTARADRRPRTFATAADALAAYRRGEVGPDHPVEVVRH